MKGDYFVCAWCGKLAWMEQWLIDEKLALGYELVCSHECGNSYAKFVAKDGDFEVIYKAPKV